MAGLALAGALVLFGCGPGRPDADAPPSARPEVPTVAAPASAGADPSSGPSSSAGATAGSDVAASSSAVVLVTEAAALARLETGGLALGPLVFGGGDATIASFRADPGWRSIRSRIERDLSARLAQDAKAGVGMRFPHRAFDVAWLDADAMRFELVAIVNRIDRRAFDSGKQRCGEVRMIYRLAYATTLEGTAVDSRLPMTVNVVFWQPGDDCGEIARRWEVPRGSTGPALADALLAGPLASTHLASTHLQAVEVNLQTIRWPGVIHPSLGGNAEYELRVFERDTGVTTGPFHPVPLENTPDVARIARSPELKSQLRDWIARDLHRLDQGIAVMPEELATDLATSVTPRGLGRLANRPFSQLLQPADLADLPLQGRDHVGTPAALLRRLDELSCQGCHETRSVAGFHIVGEPRDAKAVLDTLAVSTSAHLRGDIPRRERYVHALARGETVDEVRPFSDFEPTRGYGAHCGLGDPAFASWTCDAGLRCTALDDPLLGTCLPEGEKRAGDPCELGTLRTHAVGHRDRVRDAEITACASTAVCNVNKMGFPTGMCTAGCEGLKDGEACGPIVDFTTFNACVGRRRPFPTCIEAAAHPVGLRACDEGDRCRDDYVCARSAWSDRGVCLPPYFLFQLRVDGHVL